MYSEMNLVLTQHGVRRTLHVCLGMRRHSELLLERLPATFVGGVSSRRGAPPWFRLDAKGMGAMPSGSCTCRCRHRGVYHCCTPMLGKPRGLRPRWVELPAQKTGFGAPTRFQGGRPAWRPQSWLSDHCQESMKPPPQPGPRAFMGGQQPYFSKQRPLLGRGT